MIRSLIFLLSGKTIPVVLKIPTYSSRFSSVSLRSVTVSNWLIQQRFLLMQHMWKRGRTTERCRNESQNRKLYFMLTCCVRTLTQTEKRTERNRWKIKTITTNLVPVATTSLKIIRMMFRQMKKQLSVALQILRAAGFGKASTSMCLLMGLKQHAIKMDGLLILQ